MKKVELLAPAGNYEAFLGAIHAGADAVYLGGEKYSARAYADNFTDEEVISAIRYAHLFGKKVYITINTLIYENEVDTFLKDDNKRKPFLFTIQDLTNENGDVILKKENLKYSKFN